jgi:hypothetical protein
MIRHGPHGLRAQAYQLRSIIPFAVRIRSTAPVVKIRRDRTPPHRGINRQGRAFPISASCPAASDAHRVPNQNPKSP